MAVNIIGFSVIILFLAGIVFFMYRYLLAKKMKVKAPGYDVVGLLFFVFAFVGGCIGVVGRWLDPVIADNDIRFLVSFVILLVVVLLAYVFAQWLVRRKKS